MGVASPQNTFSCGGIPGQWLKFKPLTLSETEERRKIAGLTEWWTYVPHPPTSLHSLPKIQVLVDPLSPLPALECRNPSPPFLPDAMSSYT